jgi:acyl-CoA synthetase (AMP-forming)/AMP-acid ligase II
VAVLGYGSGTTGPPKIIPWGHRHLIARCLNISEAFKAQPGDRTMVLQEFTSLTFLARGFQCIFNGGCLVENQTFRTRSADYLPIFCDMIDRFGVSHVNCTAFHAQMIVNGLPSGTGVRFPGLKTFVVGASTVSPALRKSIQDKLTPNLCIYYGSNESGPISRAEPSVLARHPDTVGTISPGTEIAIVNEDGQIAQPGQAGTIKVRGESVVDGYYDDEAATAAHFRDGWFDTGDVGYLTDDGALYLLGRNDDMMILNGFNIHPAEIERFMEQHPCVAEVAAVSLKSELHGDIPMAFVVRKRECNEAELLSACTERLGVKAPRRIFFVNALPRNAAGKVLRRELAQQLRVT